MDGVNQKSKNKKQKIKNKFNLEIQ